MAIRSASKILLLPCRHLSLSKPYLLVIKSPVSQSSIYLEILFLRDGSRVVYLLLVL